LFTNLHAGKLIKNLVPELYILHELI